MSSSRTVVWDACCIIDYFSDNAKGDRSEDEMAALHGLAARIDRAELNLVLPSVIFSEILQTGIGDVAFGQFERFTGRSNILVADITSTVARFAGQLRDRVKADSGIKLEGMDAQYLAVALLYGAFQLHTYDKKLLNLTDKISYPGQIRTLAIVRPGLTPGESMTLPGMA